ncbi:MAG: hypothetical protein RML49_08285, partial [Verrucomicrobiae bacterium]|nr:hypothetical protein [Verrucomicrobiae bacterium]
ILDNNQKIITKQIQPDLCFTLRFIQLRPICPEEWSLLDLTLKFIAHYAAIGAKTVLKPSDEQHRADIDHHKDYGLITLETSPNLGTPGKTLNDLKQYLQPSRWHHSFNDSAFSWASLKNFWFVKEKYLTRIDSDTSTFNRLLGIPEKKPNARFRWQESQNDGKNSWLAGDIRQSKKVFSFKTPGHARTYGFAQDDKHFGSIKDTLEEIWNRNFKILRGEQILDTLLSQSTPSH